MRTGIALAAGLAVLIAALAWFARAPGPTTADQTALPAATSPKTLRVGLVSLPPDRGYPYNATGQPTIYTYRAIFDGLTFVTKDGVVEPALALSWTRADDRTWRVNLREGVTFSNGEAFDAAAVVFAVNHLLSPAGATGSVARELIGIESALAETSSQVVFKTARPEPLLPAALEQLLIVPPAYFQRVGREGFAAAPVGTGPFHVTAWGQGRIDLVAFKQSWRAPKVDALELIALPDVSSRIQGILAGQIDIAVALDVESIAALTAAGATYNVDHTPSTLALSFILTQLPPGHPLSDKRVRQALNHAVDKEAYIRTLMGGLTTAAAQPATAIAMGYNADLKPYAYDPDKAKRLLAEAGYPNGFEFVAEIVPSGGTSLSETFQQVAADLAKVGVAMTIRSITVPQLVRGVQQGEWSGQAFVFNFSSERTTDALRALRLHSCLRPAAWYCDRALTAKIEQASALGDLAERRRLTEEIVRAYHDEAPALWLHDMIMIEGLSKRVRGYRNDLTVISYHAIDLTD
ncbi:MAG: ABC transporter substrate-binding protein [Rhodospirillaceae bacterium]|nr:ABC transporter substrate-binding protein [Rhodospirillaceae bacterium]